MKRMFVALLAAFALVSLPLSFVPISGCTGPQQRKTVNTLFSVGASVDASYKSYLDLVVARKLATNSVPQVSQAYKSFQEVFGAAVTLSTLNTNAPPSAEVNTAAAKVFSAINLAKGKTK